MPNVVFNSPNDNVAAKTKNVEKALSNRAVVLIWASWCHHCVSMRNDWDKVKKDLSGDGIDFVEIESVNIERIRQENPKLMYKLTQSKLYFPMIKLASDNKLKEYSNDRTYESMKKSFKSIKPAKKAPVKKAVKKAAKKK